MYICIYLYMYIHTHVCVYIYIYAHTIRVGKIIVGDPGDLPRVRLLT